MGHRDAGGGTALDLLEEEDLALRAAFTNVLAVQGPSVEQRAEYGDLAKTIIRHVANRESALVDVASVLADVPPLEPIATQLGRDANVRREVIDRVEKMSRGIQGINLNTGQDFDKEFKDLMQIIGSEIERDLDDVIPAVRSVLEDADKINDLSSAEYVKKHAPTNINPDGPTWVERAPVISRLVTIYNHLRDFPKAVHDR